MEIANNLSSEIIQKWEEELEMIYKNKLYKLKETSLKQMDFDLYKILNSYDSYCTNAVFNELKNNGYEIEVEQPQFSFNNITTELKDDFYKMTVNFDPSKIKMKVKKVIYEV